MERSVHVMSCSGGGPICLCLLHGVCGADKNAITIVIFYWNYDIARLLNEAKSERQLKALLVFCNTPLVNIFKQMKIKGSFHSLRGIESFKKGSRFCHYCLCIDLGTRVKILWCVVMETVWAVLSIVRVLWSILGIELSNGCLV